MAGRGARLDGKPIQHPAKDRLVRLRRLARPYRAAAGRSASIAIRRSIRVSRSMGSAALASPILANGRFDALRPVRRHCRCGISALPGLIAVEGGARLTTLEGGPWFDISGAEPDRSACSARRRSTTRRSWSCSHDCQSPLRGLNHAVLYVRDLDRRRLTSTGRLRLRRSSIASATSLLSCARRARPTITTWGLMPLAQARPRPPRGSTGLYHLAWEVPRIEDLASRRGGPPGRRARWVARATTA